MNKNNELDYIRNKYLYPGAEIHYKGSNLKWLQKIIELLLHAQTYEAPDAYAIDNENNVIIAIEHFEFDSSKNKNKGSQQRSSIAEIDRIFLKNSPNSCQAVINAGYSMENYHKNLVKIFNKHYLNIKDYKNNIITFGNSETLYKALFFIEDTSALGNKYFCNQDKVGKSLFLPFCDFFIDLFENSIDLEYVICAGFSGYEDYLWYMDRDSIPHFRQNQVLCDNITLIDWSPQCTSHVIKIDKEEN